MSNLKFLKIIGIIAGVVLLGIAIGWLGSRGSQATNKTQNPNPVTTATESNPSTQPGAVVHAEPVGTTSQTHAKTNPAGTSATTTSTSTNLITDWEDRVDNILGPEGDDAQKVKQLLAMFPRLPEDGQTEVAEHLSNLTTDEDFASTLGRYLTNSTLPESVLDVLMSDLLNRPNSIKLPLLVDVARDSQNPKSGEAKDLLELFLEEDYGNDWTTWQAKVDQWVKDNPD